MANLPDALFCSHCGASIDAKRQSLKTASTDERKPDLRRFIPSKKLLKLISIAVVVVVVGAAVWALLAWESNSARDSKEKSLAPSIEFGSPVPASYAYQKEIRTLQVDLPINSVSEPLRWDEVSLSVKLEGWKGTDSKWDINTSKGDSFSRMGAEPESVGYQIVNKVGNSSQWDYMALEFISYGDRSIDTGDHLRLTSNDFRVDSNGTSITPGYWTITVIKKETGDPIASTSFNVLGFE